MKRNDFALLLVIIMMVGCILVSAPAVFAAETDTTEGTTEAPAEDVTEETTEAPTEEATEAPTEEAGEIPTVDPQKVASSPIPEPYKTIIVFILNFFKRIFALLGI